MTLPTSLISVATAVIVTIFVAACQTVPTNETAHLGYATRSPEAYKLEQKSQEALRKLYSKSPTALRIGHQALAVLVFPNITKAGFVVGGQHGNGTLFFRDQGVGGYYSTVAASYGIQAGIQNFGYALFIMDEEALRNLKKTQGWEIGSSPSLVVVDVGLAKSMNTTSLTKGVYAFFFNQKGLMAGTGLQGSKITRINP